VDVQGSNPCVPTIFSGEDMIVDEGISRVHAAMPFLIKAFVMFLVYRVLVYE
jgi:hypothetical protein